MALTDLLWACPECHEDRALEPRGSVAVCRRCGARYNRGGGATIVRTRPDGSEAVRSAADWIDRLPDATAALEKARGEHLRSARALRRTVVAMEPVHAAGRYLNRVERFGEADAGRVILYEDRITFHPETPVSATAQWPFQSLTAVQTSSRTLQLKGRGRPLASFRFTDDSIFLWEQLVNEAVRRFYRRAGLGEILEFQPRITTA